MIIELNEKNFQEEVAKHKKVLVFFYREKGCSFCDKMKPVVDEYEKLPGGAVLGKYKLGNAPDSITEGVVERFPTFVAYVDGLPVGKQEGAMALEKLDLTFEQQKQQAAQPAGQPPAVIPVEQASLQQLYGDKFAIVDQIAKLKDHLNKIDKEINTRTQLVYGED